MSIYLAIEEPPRDLVASVRAIVLREGEVLAVRDPNVTHIWPGGRVEAGESLEEALHREVGEETGWRIDTPRFIGIRHFRHLLPKPDGYKYDYPAFIQAVYAARATEFDATLREQDGYELSADFRPLDALDSQGITASERVCLARALELLARD